MTTDETTKNTQRIRNVFAAGGILVVALGSALLFGALSRSSSGSAGDPGGLILRSIVPYASQVARATNVHVAWFDNLPCPLPANYAEKIESHLDSCDGMAGTFGWDPVIVQMGVQWTGGVAQLEDRVTRALALDGFVKGNRSPPGTRTGLEQVSRGSGQILALAPLS